MKTINNSCIETKNKNNEVNIQCFKPIIYNDSKILILGTMPGKESLSTREYYAHKRNLFWQIMSNIFNNDMPFKSYSEKIECFKHHNIALWDVIESCNRKGSLDKKIEKPKINDIENLLKEHPSIKKIIFNGKKAKKYYTPSICFEIALSTSPANRYSNIEITESWIKALLH
ncbi:MAG: DNA-deoxyinosine glycosylase [Bacteroidales bacterium]|jgi:hypoxanthine-DNA glycosylase|nr:DNA-deoxyinosine glycosylase [Bacteroidales bacterium]